MCRYGGAVEIHAFSLSREQPVEELAGVAAGFRDRQSFEDYPRYVRNVNRVVEYFGFLGNTVLRLFSSHFLKLREAPAHQREERAAESEATQELVQIST